MSLWIQLEDGSKCQIRSDREHTNVLSKVQNVFFLSRKNLFNK